MTKEGWFQSKHMFQFNLDLFYWLVLDLLLVGIQNVGLIGDSTLTEFRKKKKNY